MLYNYHRRKSSDVQIGQITMGGNNPIRIQSMTNTSTNDTEGSAQQIIRIADVGADLVRLTAQGTKEALNLANIKEYIRQKSYNLPLVADIHFNANVADVAATIVEKVRINPGNYVDPGRSFKKLEYTDEEYAQEIEKIRNRLIPFLDICKAHHTAIRIGVNHGSLSDRIMSRYGDTPAGMVESCMEFLRICREQQFDNVVISIKASNTCVMVLTVRLLVETMAREQMAYPIHLGVTEAGDGEDGRIKSAVGIGALLADGLGDTIRVSLSEDPECEIPVAQKLVDYIAQRAGHNLITGPASPSYNPHQPERMTTTRLGVLGNNQPVCVCGNTDDGADTSVEGMYVCALTDIISSGTSIAHLLAHPEQAAVLCADAQNPVGSWRAMLFTLRQAGCTNPIVLCHQYDDTNLEDLQLKAAADFGVMLIDNLADGILIQSSHIPSKDTVQTAFAILQAARARFTKTEYIACPSCGRTLFDLQATLARIKKATAGLPGLKIGVMGCIVNGPGEMADADYGYVGAGPGKVSLYKGKTCVERNIPSDEAVEKLLALIKADQHIQ